MVEIDADAVVIRFRPTELDAVVRQAMKAYRYDGYYGLSVFADVKKSGESDEDTERRLVEVAHLGNISREGNRSYSVARAGDLERFSFRKDEKDDKEAPEHYTVDMGSLEELEATVADFLSSFRKS